MHEVTKLQIRNTKKSDYRSVEEITRKAFWNPHVPGCDDHYLAYKLRNHKDYIPELDYVAEKIGKLLVIPSIIIPIYKMETTNSQRRNKYILEKNHGIMPQS